MDERHLNFGLVTIPRWTIRRDPRTSPCPLCGSLVVRIKADAKRLSFCTCRLLEYQVIPKAGTTAE